MLILMMLLYSTPAINSLCAFQEGTGIVSYCMEVRNLSVVDDKRKA